jgi:hypothetical protein
MSAQSTLEAPAMTRTHVRMDNGSLFGILPSRQSKNGKKGITQ